MGVTTIGRGRGIWALLAVVVLGGCADEGDPAYLASLLEDPVETENALEKLRKMLDERLQGNDEKAQSSAVGDYSSRATDGLVAAFKRAEGNPLVQTRIISILTRTIGYTKSASLRQKVLNDVFLPVLDAFKDKGDDPAQASLIVDTLAGMMKPPAGAEPLLDGAMIESAMTKIRDVSAGVRASWGCKERTIRMQGQKSPVADQEQLLLSCIEGTAKLLGSDVGKGGQSAGVPILLDALRESFYFQDFYLNRAAADAIDKIAPFLGPEFVKQVTPALIEGLFLQGDFFLYPYVRRAVVHLAALSDDNRNTVIEELLRMLNVDMDEAVEKELPDLSSLGKNDRLDLLRLPCGTTLSSSCAEKETALREYRDKGWAPAKAACNRGADPDRPGSGFQWGFNYEVIWEKFGSMLVDIVTPVQGGTPPDRTSKVGLAIAALQTEVALMDRWVAKVKAAKKLHETIVGLYDDFMSSRAANAEAQGTAEAAPAAAATPETEPKLAEDVQPLYEQLKTLRASEGTKFGPEARQVTVDLIAVLSKPEAEADDREACQPLIKGVFTDVQTELLTLADFDSTPQYQKVNLMLWRSVSAARYLALLGVAGQDDETLHQVLRITQFALDTLMGFPVTPLKAFPQMVLRFKQPFTPDGMPMMPQPAIPGLIDAIQNFQRPTPAVMNFLMQMMAASALTNENGNATILQEKFFMLNMDVTTFRAMAARAFFAVFRHGDVLPDADTYRDLYEFYTGDVQYILALEKTTDSDPAFQLYPPFARPVEGQAAVEAAAVPEDWMSAMPAKSPLFNFDTYRDPLARCVMYEQEDRKDRAKWNKEMRDPDKIAYCKKWVEPWASLFREEMATQDIPKLAISEERCWATMRTLHEDEFQYCVAIDQQKPPAKELGLTKEQCDAVKDADDEYLYCVDLRFAPEYTEQKLPTLWGCYDKYPWLRGREPIGPICQHLAGRTLAATMYVKLRSAAGAPAPDGVTFDKLNALMTLPELMAFTKNFGTDQNEEQFRKFDQLVAELAKVQLDFPVFKRPEEDDAIAKTTAKKPEEVVAPDYVLTPWYWHDGWVTREPRDFSDLRKTFMDSCRPEGDDTATECAKDGGKLGNQMKITIEGGATGPLMEQSQGFAIMLMRQDLVGVGEMRDALLAVESKCYAGTYDMACLADAALAGADREDATFVNPSCRGMTIEALGCTEDPDNPEVCQEKRDELAASICASVFTTLESARGMTPIDLNKRVRAVYLLAALADQDRPKAEAAVADLLLTVDSDARFLPPVTFALQKIRPKCCPPGQEGQCQLLGCERVRLFAQYWNTQPIRDTQVPDVDALYYMLLASR
ncbi:MAG: hypothetical protein HY905_24685 [Deltaproteobacteria bacterium]|nr:hypothetical protein [Deltaproteobacteria bacterium]